MKNLGRIALVFLSVTQLLFAAVTASVSSKNVSYGEVVTLNLSLSGEDIKRPEIYSVCGEDVIGTGSSTSINIVNGSYQKNYILSYKFVAKKSCTIEPIELEIAGKKYKTEAINVEVSKHKASKSDNFFLELRASKSELYVGESFDLTLLFKQRKSSQVVDNKFERPDFQGFWLKGEPKQEISEDSEFVSTKLTFTLSAQRDGNLLIEPAKISLATRENKRDYWGGFFPDVTWKTYFSNDLNLSVKKPPEDVDLVGNVILQATVDKTEINPNEAVNLTLKLQGNANLEDLKSFKPFVPDVSIFDEKINIKDDLLTQKITFVADESFTIEPFSLRVFNPQTKEIKKIATKAIKIKVTGSKTKEKDEKIVIQRPSEEPIEDVSKQKQAVKAIDKFALIVIFFVGVIVGIVIMILIPYMKFRKSKRKYDLKDHKKLMIKLLPFKENDDVQQIISILEENLYSDKKKEIDKKVLKELIKKYDLDS